MNATLRGGRNAAAARSNYECRHALATLVRYALILNNNVVDQKKWETDIG
jgi:hypothetical protein